MCDYSLMGVPNRLAREGEELVTHRFPSGSMGLASHLDLHAEPSRSAPGPRTFWSMVKQILDAPAAKPIPAICIPPGARLLLTDISDQWQKELGVGATEEVTFTQISASVNSYRDSVRFSNGHVVLLQRLREGQTVRVLALGPDEGIDFPAQEEARAASQVK